MGVTPEEMCSRLLRLNLNNGRQTSWWLQPPDSRGRHVGDVNGCLSLIRPGPGERKPYFVRSVRAMHFECCCAKSVLLVCPSVHYARIRFKASPRPATLPITKFATLNLTDEVSHRFLADTLSRQDASPLQG